MIEKYSFNGENTSFSNIRSEEQDFHSNTYSEDVKSISNISIICPSPKGKAIAKKLQEYFNAKLYIKENHKSLNRARANLLINEDNRSLDNLNNITYPYGEDFNLSHIAKEAMLNSKGIIFIASTGIAVRAIAPFLVGKDKDPGVVVIDLACKYAINILSGHLGGGNELTFKAAEALGAMPIVTTASDNLGIIAPDILAKENELVIEDLKKAKYISALLVDGAIIGIKDDYETINISKGYKEVQELKEDCIWITHFLKPKGNTKSLKHKHSNLDYSKILRLIKRDLVLGVGCRKGTSYEKLYEFIKNNLEEYNLDIRAISLIASVDVKANEEGIIKLAEKLNCTFKTFTREEIKNVQDKYDKSLFVEKTLGVTGVCEPCVDLAGAEVIISKIKHEGMTLAIGILKNT